MAALCYKTWCQHLGRNPKNYNVIVNMICFLSPLQRLLQWRNGEKTVKQSQQHSTFLSFLPKLNPGVPLSTTTVEIPFGPKTKFKTFEIQLKLWKNLFNTHGACFNYFWQKIMYFAKYNYFETVRHIVFFLMISVYVAWRIRYWF